MLACKYVRHEGGPNTAAAQIQVGVRTHAGVGGATADPLTQIFSSVLYVTLGLFPLPLGPASRSVVRHRLGARTCCYRGMARA